MSIANILNQPWAYLNSTTELPVADSDFVLKSSNILATGILNGYEHFGAVQTFWINHEHTWTVQTLFRMSIWIGNRQLMPVADSDFVLKSSNKLATGILNGDEHFGAVQTF